MQHEPIYTLKHGVVYGVGHDIRKDTRASREAQVYYMQSVPFACLIAFEMRAIHGRLATHASAARNTTARHYDVGDDSVYEDYWQCARDLF
jgi:hypothetical protein